MTDDNEFKRPPRPGEWFRVHPYEQKEIMLLHHDGKEYLVAENMVQRIREKYPDQVSRAAADHGVPDRQHGQ